MTRVKNIVVLAFFITISFSNAKEKVIPIDLNEVTWVDMLEGEWMVEFYAPWCPACRQLTETWEKFSSWGRDLDIKVAKVDVTENPGLSGRFLIFALPTIYHVKDGVFREYIGAREENEFISFVDDKKWQNIEPVSCWTNPSYPHMAVVSWFFKAAMAVRSIFNLLTEDYGVPGWFAYVIFGIATIIAGLLLGLCLVCCCDMICPPRYSTPVQGGRETVNKDKESDEEVDDEEEEDESESGETPGDGDSQPVTRRRKTRKT